jgi:hypothetical protein
MTKELVNFNNQIFENYKDQKLVSDLMLKRRKYLIDLIKKNELNMQEIIRYYCGYKLGLHKLDASKAPLIIKGTLEFYCKEVLKKNVCESYIIINHLNKECLKHYHKYDKNKYIYYNTVLFLIQKEIKEIMIN